MIVRSTLRRGYRPLFYINVKEPIVSSKSLEDFKGEFIVQNDFVSKNTIDNYLVELFKCFNLNVKIETDHVFKAKSVATIASFIIRNEELDAKIRDNAFSIANILIDVFFDAYLDDYEVKIEQPRRMEDVFLDLMRDEMSAIYSKFQSNPDFSIYREYDYFFRNILKANTYELWGKRMKGFKPYSNVQKPDLWEINTGLKHFKERWFKFKGLDLEKEDILGRKLLKFVKELYSSFKSLRRREKMSGRYFYSEAMLELIRKAENSSLDLVKTICFIGNKITQIEFEFLCTYLNNESIIVEDKNVTPIFKFGKRIIGNVSLNQSVYVRVNDRKLEKVTAPFDCDNLTFDDMYKLIKKEKKYVIFYKADFTYEKLRVFFANRGIKINPVKTIGDLKILKELKKRVLLSLDIDDLVDIKQIDELTANCFRSEHDDHINLLLRENMIDFSDFFNEFANMPYIKRLLRNKYEREFFERIKIELTKKQLNAIDFYYYLSYLNKEEIIEKFEKNGIYISKYQESIAFKNVKVGFFADAFYIYDFSNAKKFDYLHDFGFSIPLTTIINSRGSPIYLHKRNSLMVYNQTRKRIIRRILLYTCAKGYRISEIIDKNRKK